jgi:protein-tyrosine phosphatase
VIIEWHLEGGRSGVEIAAGPTPHAGDHHHVLSATADVSSVRLDSLGSEQRYVSIRPSAGAGVVVAGERRLPFEGLQNFRDLGGYRTAGGGHTVWGQIFRSDSLHKVTAADLVAFDRMGMRTVYDLRGDKERETHPNPFDSIQLAVAGQPRNGEGRAIDPELFAAASDGERLLRDLYIGMLLHSAHLFGELLTGLTDPGNRPAVFHCHAGKDRTGVAAALLLLALGVDRNEVLDDYELTRRYRTLDHQQDSLANLLEAGLSPEAAAGVLTAPRWAMQEAVDAIDGDYDGIDAYLTGPAGMSDASLRELRRVLVQETY